MTEEQSKELDEAMKKTAAGQMDEASKAINKFGKELVKALQPTMKAMSGVAAQMTQQMAKFYEEGAEGALTRFNAGLKKENDKKKPNPFQDEREI